MLYTDEELERSSTNITAIDYHQQVDLGGIKFTAFNAGHVLGAAMFLVEIAAVKLLYTGDYSREEDRHLMAAENPHVPLDVLVVESTYGVQSHQPRTIRESRFTTAVKTVVQRGGRCLIPVFALGRAQELLLILDEFWQAHPELHDVPVYYASALAKKCMAIYQTYVHMMNEGIKKQIASGNNPFNFKHVRNLRSARDFSDSGPCVMMASPAMLQSGFSRDLFEAWCSNRNNGIIIPGYVVEGTLGKEILTEPKEVLSQTGQLLPLRMSVDYISFSAHVDFGQNSAFIDEVKASHVILVHGEASEAGRLKSALQHRYAPSVMKIYTPRNCESVELVFQGQRYVKVIGALADTLLKQKVAIDSTVDHSVVDKETTADDSIAVSSAETVVEGGILIAKDFQYQMMLPEDLAEYATPALKPCIIQERMIIPSRATMSLLEHLLVGLFGRKQIVHDGACLVIMKEFRLGKSGDDSIAIEWVGNSVNDMLADSIIALVLSAENSRAAVKATQQSHHMHEAEERHPLMYLDVVKRYLEERFGPVEEVADSYVLNGQVRVSLEDLSVYPIEQEKQQKDDQDLSSYSEDESAFVNEVKAAVASICDVIAPHFSK